MIKNPLRNALILLTALSLGNAALAAGVAAGTDITNTASADYNDPDGGAQTTTSNTVTTKVAPKAGVNVSPGTNDKTAVAAGDTYSYTPGATVRVDYVLTNTGNFTNDYALSAPTITIPLTGGTNTTVTPTFWLVDNAGVLGAQITGNVSLVADGTQKFAMRYTLPNNALVTGSFVAEPIATAQIITFTSGATTFNSIPKVTDGNNISATTGNGVAEVLDGNTDPADNYHKINIIAGATISAVKSVVGTYTDAAATTAISGSRAKIGNYVKYQIVVNNSSTVNDATAVSITDALPAGTTYTSGTTTSGTISHSAGTVTVNPTSNTIAKNTGVTITIIAQITALTDTVGSDSINDPLKNSAAVAYTDPNAGVQTPVNSNTTTTDVGGDQVGPGGFPAGNAGAGATDDVANYGQPGGQTVTLRKDGDSTIIDSIRLKSTGTTDVVFPQTIKNTGTAADTFTLSAANTPAGATVKFYTTYDPITGVYSGEITAATASVPAGGTLTYFTVVSLPNTFPGTMTLSVTATSVSSGATDSTTDVIGAKKSGVTGANDDGAANLTNDADETVDIPGVVSKTTLPNKTVVYPLDLVNSNANTVNLVPAGSVNISAGLPINYFADTNNDGVYTAGTDLATSSVAVASGAEVRIFAVINVPAGATPGTYNLTQSFTDTPNGVTLSTGTSTFPIDQLVVTNYNWAADQSATITKPGSNVYTHTLTNNAPTGSGENITKFNLTDNNTNTTGFIFTYYFDTDGSGNFNSGDAQITEGTDFTLGTALAPGNNVKIFAKVVHDGSGVIPQSNTTNVILAPTFSSAGLAPSSFVADTTTLRATTGTPTDPKLGGPYTDPKDNPENYGFKPYKSVDKATAKPGETVTYTIYGKNTRVAAATLSGVILSDTLNTNLTSLGFSVTTNQTGNLFYRINGGAWTAYTSAVTTGIADGAKIEVGVDTNASSTITSADNLATGNWIQLVINGTVK